LNPNVRFHSRRTLRQTISPHEIQRPVVFASAIQVRRPAGGFPIRRSCTRPQIRHFQSKFTWTSCQSWSPGLLIQDVTSHLKVTIGRVTPEHEFTTGGVYSLVSTEAAAPMAHFRVVGGVREYPGVFAPETANVAAGILRLNPGLHASHSRQLTHTRLSNR